MASTALKTLLLCEFAEQRPAASSSVQEILTEGQAVPGHPGLYLFDRPRQAVSCALRWNALAAEHGVASLAVVHLGEVETDVESVGGGAGETDGERQHDAVFRLESMAITGLERLRSVARYRQTLVSGVVEGMLRGTSSDTLTATDGMVESWFWLYHGRYRWHWGDDAETVSGAAPSDQLDIYEVAINAESCRGAPALEYNVSRVIFGSSGAMTDSSVLRPGASLGRYRIDGVLGRGGMGVVYRAHDLRMRRDVALKTLPPHLAKDREHLARFEREMLAVAAVNHPNIVTIHTVEEDRDVRFLTMELVEGQSLAEALVDGGLGKDTWLRVALDITGALEEAHSRGIVHRDLKPKNVMLTPEGRVKVLDFGLAKLRGDDAPVDSATRDGQMLGTLFFMSPEQLQAGPVDARSDIFSLGVVLHEMATGERLWKGRGASVMFSIVSQPPPPIDRPDLPPGTDALIARCLAKLPESRWQSAGELRQALLQLERGKLGHGEPALGHRAEESATGISVAAEQSTSYDSKRWAMLGLLLTVLIITLVAGIGFSTSRLGSVSIPGADEARRGMASKAFETPQRIVVLPFVHEGAPEDAYFANGICAEITAKLSSLDRLRVISFTSAKVYANSELSPKEIGRELGVDFVLTGTVQWQQQASGPHVRIQPELIRSSDALLVWTASFDRRLDDIFEMQREISQKVASSLGYAIEDAERLTAQRPTANTAAYMAYLSGLHFASTPDYAAENRLRVIKSFSRAVSLDDDFMLAHAELAKAHALFYQLRHDRSETRRQAAKASVARAIELDPDSAQARLALGLVLYWTDRNYAAALVELDKAASRMQNLPEIWEALAWVERRHGRPQASWDHFQKALQLNPRDPALLSNVGLTAMWLRRYRESMERFDQSIREAPYLPMAYWNKAQALWLWTGRTQDSASTLEAMQTDDSRADWFWFRQHYYERDAEAALARLQNVEGWVRITDFEAPVSFPQALARELAGDQARALDDWRDAAAQLRMALEDRPDDPRLNSALGMALAAMGERDGAIAAGRRAVELLPIERDAYEGPSYVEHLAMIHARLGDSDAAIELLEEQLSRPSRTSVPLLRLDPRWDGLRQNARFQRLLEKFESPQ